jgi:hypothetical protein
MARIDMFILGALGFAGLSWLAVALRLRPGLWIDAHWHRLTPRLRCYVSRSPATFIYAAIIFVTTWVVAGLDAQVSEEVLRAQSTNIDNLSTNPIDVLFRSMFWSGSTVVLPFIALIALVLAPAEVWLGTRRLIVVFALGHVLATLATALAISQGYFVSAADKGIDRTIDVGVSYGCFCVASILTYRLPKRWRPGYALALLLLSGLLAFVIGRTFTDLGHFVSVILGLALYPIARGHTVAERARIPLYRPWRDVSAPMSRSA